jgi:SAM-dependent methyltransferase
MPLTDARIYAPSAARNRDPILEVLRQHLPPRGLVIEIASGSGEHTAHFAAASGPELIFQPSDPDARSRASIDAWARALGLRNVLPAIALDAAIEDWHAPRADVVISINMIHIAPWAATVGLITNASKVLDEGGVLFLYGPYRRQGIVTAPSNDAFDRDLKQRNPKWGLRNLEDVAALARSNGFSEAQITGMPANNLSVVFHKGRA